MIASGWNSRLSQDSNIVGNGPTKACNHVQRLVYCGTLSTARTRWDIIQIACKTRLEIIGEKDCGRSHSIPALFGTTMNGQLVGSTDHWMHDEPPLTFIVSAKLCTISRTRPFRLTGFLSVPFWCSLWLYKLTSQNLLIRNLRISEWNIMFSSPSIYVDFQELEPSRR